MKKIILNRVLKQSPNYRKYFAMVSDKDYSRVNKYNWSVAQNCGIYYALGYIDGKMISMHIFIMGRKGIDHKDNNGLNNQRGNLRLANVVENGANRKLNLNSKSGYKGVSWKARESKWSAKIQHNGIPIYLGLFADKHKAAKAYNDMALRLNGKFAKLNNTHAIDKACELYGRGE